MGTVADRARAVARHIRPKIPVWEEVNKWVTWSDDATPGRG
jgi:hypothetical protein